MSFLSSLRQRSKELKRFTLVAYYAARDPRTPIYVRVLALLVAAYALSPIDLIPDFIPVLGYLDDLVLIPLGLALVVRLLPAAVLDSARARAQETADRPVSVVGAVAIVVIWLVVLFLLGRWALIAMRT
jgi:uncharacterized membrane protein YkvA (DUF1232 family)